MILREDTGAISVIEWDHIELPYLRTSVLVRAFIAVTKH